MAKFFKRVFRFYAVIALLRGTSATDNETTTATAFLSISPQQLELAGNIKKYTATVVATTTGATITISATSRATEVLTKVDRSTDTVVSTETVRHSLGRGFPLPHYHQPDSRWGPFFEEGQDPYNITARIGSTVILDCRIGLLQDKTVTWLHHKEESIHLLTVGRNAYSSDERITLSFRYPNNFRLEIAYVTRRDEGLYECQVATHPPKVKKIFLRVTAPEVEIVDESGRVVTERYYKAGSSLELMCHGVQIGADSDENPIVWKQGDTVLTAGISANVSISSDSAVSTLTITPMQRQHSGNYTCAVGALALATVAVHVLNGELPAAVHHGNGAIATNFTPMLLVLTLAYLVLRFR